MYYVDQGVKDEVYILFSVVSDFVFLRSFNLVYFPSGNFI